MLDNNTRSKFASDDRRLCVAMSRARYRLILIGNAKALNSAKPRKVSDQTPAPKTLAPARELQEGAVDLYQLNQRRARANVKRTVEGYHLDNRGGKQSQKNYAFQHRRCESHSIPTSAKDRLVELRSLQRGRGLFDGLMPTAKQGQGFFWCDLGTKDHGDERCAACTTTGTLTWASRDASNPRTRYSTSIIWSSGSCSCRYWHMELSTSTDTAARAATRSLV